MKDLQPINFPGLDPRRPLVIAGPCSAETEEQVIETARELAAEGVRIFRAGLWKPRTKPGGFEGVGAEGVAWLRRVKRETGMYTATEVATRKHVMAALEGGIDMIWIGARTTANPFAMQEIADALRGHDIPVLVKNPVSPDLELWIGGVERIYNAGIRRLGVIHRGFTSIDKSLYRNHPMWSIPIELHRRLPGLQIFCDPSHIGGRRELIAPLSQQAMDLGFDGLIVEAHCSPDCAWSDKAQQVTPQGLAYICRSLVIREANTTTESLSELRSQIDKIDDELLELLVRRMRVSRDIGQYKKEHNMPILQAKRYEDLLARRAEQAVQLGMDREFMRSVLQAIHEESIRQQMQVLGVQRRTGPRHAPRTLVADSARRHDGRDERIQDGPAAPGAARNGRSADHLLHGQRHRGRHGRGTQHRSRRLYRQAFLRARSAGPRALRTAPHRT